eukprot:TRINITY_DN17643_c0_g1_i1.p1 TRINITY_DN17643_c0_g1~~TRINITY_DN17643_c0_g1_i1.p1  ORF type:complete len:235 (+),score=56.55 TRINITY_DN17643_c0_g1_i1:131-835(+)
MKKFVRYINDYNGRDKFYRTIQYGLKMLVFYTTEIRNLKKEGRGEIPTFLAGFEKGLSSGRKLMRIGSIPGSYMTFINSLNEKQLPLRILTAIRDFLGFIFLFFDHVNWLASSAAHKALAWDTKKSERFVDTLWLIGLVLSTIIDTIKYVQDLQLIEKIKKQAKNDQQKETDAKEEIKKINDRNKNLPFKYIKNFFDMPVAMSAIDLLNINLGWKGFFGFVSSFSSAYLLWPAN